MCLTILAVSSFVHVNLEITRICIDFSTYLFKVKQGYWRTKSPLKYIVFGHDICRVSLKKLQEFVLTFQTIFARAKTFPTTFAYCTTEIA